MWRKLRVYFIGVGLGCVLAWALFLRNRNTKDYLAWTPNERVMAPLRVDGALQKPDNYVCLLKCNNLTSLDMEQLLEKGMVDFSESKPREIPKMYVVKYELENSREIRVELEFETDSLATLTQLVVLNENPKCDC